MTTINASIHPVWPSAFQWVEQPLYHMNKEYNHLSTDENLAWVKMRMKQCICWPIVMCATPVSCLADAAAGIVEAALSKYQGDLPSRATSILQKKLIASPVQHLVFFSCNLLIPALLTPFMWALTTYLTVQLTGNVLLIPGLMKTIITSTIIVGPLAGFLSYHKAQKSVGKLPNWARPQGFNIFINEGCCGRNGIKLTDPDYDTKMKDLNRPYSKTIGPKEFAALKKIKDNPMLSRLNLNQLYDECYDRYKQDLPKEITEDSWAEFIKPYQEQITLINKPSEQLNDFETFSNAVKNGLSPEACLGLANNELTLNKIKKAFYKWAPILHPDKNPNNKTTEMLFKTLCLARELLEKPLLEE